MTETALEVRGLRRAFRTHLLMRRREVLRGIDLRLDRGRALGLVGPNGSGKSTLMRILAGTDRPDTGWVTVLGGSARSADVKRRVGYLPEDSPFPGELTARAALDLLGSLQGLARGEIRSRGQELLQRVGLEPHASVALARYSRGMLRRFGLAQALLHDPDVLLLDEPTAGLDAPGFLVLDAILGEARAAGRTVVLCSHLVSDVHAYCDELAVLLDGRVATQGAPGTLLGDSGRTELVLEGFAPGDKEALEHWLGEHGARLVSSHAVPGTMLELYRRLAEGESS